MYLAQPSTSQLIPGGSGLGTFNANQTASLGLNDNPNNTLALLTGAGAPNEGTGQLLRYASSVEGLSRFPDISIPLDIPSGVSGYTARSCLTPKLTCEPTYHALKADLLILPRRIPFSNQSFTYAYLPQDFLRGLFAEYGMPLPVSLTKPDLTLRDPNDAIPAEIDPSEISYLSEFLFSLSTPFTSDSHTAVKWWNNGVAHSFHTRTILDTGAIGWTTVETVLIRLNTTYTPSGVFPVYSNVTTDTNGLPTSIGYDAAVCVERYEPWVVEVYNTTVGSPTTLRIIEKFNGNTSLPSGKIRGNPLETTRYLNTTGKNPAFYVAHDNSINQMVKDNGRDFFYVPSPTVSVVFPSRVTFLLTLRFLTGSFFY